MYTLFTLVIFKHHELLVSHFMKKDDTKHSFIN